MKRLLFDVHTDEKVPFPVKFLTDNCTLNLKIEVPILKNDDFIERLPLPVNADACYLARLRADG